MKKVVKLIAIDKLGWPVELFKGRPITNAIRIFLHGDHYECRNCWYSQQSTKSSGTLNTAVGGATQNSVSPTSSNNK